MRRKKEGRSIVRRKERERERDKERQRERERENGIRKERDSKRKR